MVTPRHPHALAALTSLALVALELVWTRVFSAEFFYTFAFLTLSLAVLGLGLGGLALRLGRKTTTPARIGPLLVATGALALAGPPLALHSGLNFAQLFAGWGMAARFLGTVLLLSSAYFTGGMALSLLFRSCHEDMPRLYRADLLGAAAGVVGIILLMNTAGVPVAAVLLPLPLAVAAFLAGGRRTRIAAGVLAACVCLVLPKAGVLIRRPRQERLPVIQRHWDAMGLVKVQQGEGYRNLNIDNMANTGVGEFDGDWSKAEASPEPFPLAIKPLVDAMGGTCTFLSLGSGGGGDVFQALQAGAREVHAVEVNPAINRLLTQGSLRDYSGRLYLDPRVKVVTEDARAYVRRFDQRFDVIFSLSSNTFAAMASGAFALAENYLFTVEAYEDYYRALTDRGVLVMEHQRYVPRMAAEALEALRELGVQDPGSHLAVLALPAMHRQVLILSRRPLDPALFRTANAGRPFGEVHELYPVPAAGADPLVHRILTEGWRKAAPGAAIDISPCRDSRPFTAQLGLWKNFKLKRLPEPSAMDFNGFPASKAMIVAILLVVSLLVLPLNLLPALKRGPGLGWGYFFAIGAGFMILEVVLIQKYALLIGPSSYTVAAILFTLLAGSGIGSRYAASFRDRTPFLAILAWLAADGLLFGRATHALAGLPIPGRAAATILLLAPLAFFMGMPFTKGTRRAGDRVDWGFAVNGAAGVLASAAVMLVSFTWGFPAALATGGLAYAAALALLSLKGRAWGCS
jgi:hypothetical protein